MFLKPSVAKIHNIERSSWAPALILFVGFGTLTLLITADWIRDRLIDVQMVRLDALVEIQLAGSTAHLWLEEYVSGDDVDLDRITLSLERASQLSRALLNGGQIADYNMVIPPMQSGHPQSAASELLDHQRTFSQLTELRLAGMQQNEDVGIGSPMDDVYDLAYQNFLDAAKNVEGITRQKLTESTLLARLLYYAILVSWMIIILLAVTGLRTHERRRSDAEDALRRKEAQLAQSQKMDAMGRLAGGITHDINNYVAAITTNCELLLMDTGSNSQVRKKMGTVLSVAGKISALVERLLSFSSKLPAHSKSVDLNTLIIDFGEIVKPLIGEDIELDFHLNQNLWPIWIDPGQVEQILMNLTVNARQAMSDGGKITIATQNAVVNECDPTESEGVAPGDYVVLTCSDNGPGLTKDIQEKVFEPFFTTKEATRNSGLGLSTIYGIVQQNSGYIRLYSEPGRGATFKIYLPRSTANPDVQSDTAVTRSPEPTQVKVILLVEDDDEFRLSAKNLLQMLGFEVITEKDGENAHQTYLENHSRIDLIITDVVLPGMNGQEFSRLVRSLDKSVPIIFMSGYTADVILDQGLIKERLNILKKPFSADDISRKIAQAIGADEVP